METSYDYFSFYLRTTFISIIVTLWAMDQPQQFYKIFRKIHDPERDNFVIDKTFIKIHLFLIVANVLSFLINLRTNVITKVVPAFEVVVFGSLVLCNGTLYYYNFIRTISRKGDLAMNQDLALQTDSPVVAAAAPDSSGELSASEDENKKTMKIMLWILTLVTIGKSIVSPAYIFYENPKITEQNPEVYLFLDNINNELILFLLVLVFITEFVLKSDFFKMSSIRFNSLSDFVATLKNNFKIYVIGVLALVFLNSKAKFYYLWLVQLLIITSSSAIAYWAYYKVIKL